MVGPILLYFIIATETFPGWFTHQFEGRNSKGIARIHQAKQGKDHAALVQGVALLESKQ
jgi:hypothetical protein